MPNENGCGSDSGFPAAEEMKHIIKLINELTFSHISSIISKIH